MTIKVCPQCKKEKDTRGFNVHIISCKAKAQMEVLRKRYAHQIADMSPSVADRFLRKAQEAGGGR